MLERVVLESGAFGLFLLLNGSLEDRLDGADCADYRSLSLSHICLRQLLSEIRFSILLACVPRQNLVLEALELLFDPDYVLVAFVLEGFLQSRDQLGVIIGKLSSELPGHNLTMYVVRLVAKNRLQRAIHSIGLLEELLNLGL